MRRLLGARVLLAGCGGLGGHVAGLLARLGVGAFVLCDPDSFTESNLNRQAFCTESTLGLPKAEVAAQAVRDMAGHADVVPHVLAVTADNLPALLDGVDVALDCLDSVADKSLLENACLRAGVSFVHGGVLRHEGMVFRNVPERDTASAGAPAGALGSRPDAQPEAGLRRLYPQGQSAAHGPPGSACCPWPGPPASWSDSACVSCWATPRPDWAVCIIWTAASPNWNPLPGKGSSRPCRPGACHHESIFCLERFALHTIRPVASQDPRGVFAWSGLAALCLRLALPCGKDLEAQPAKAFGHDGYKGNADPNLPLEQIIFDFRHV